MGRSFETEVRLKIEAWLHWLPKWEPGTGLSRARPCRKCLGSPFIVASGMGLETPHTVKHALVMRLNQLLTKEVDRYIQLNLPLMFQELQQDEVRRSKLPYRPTEGLDPEFEGLELDPPDNPQEPFLFTIAELASQMAQHELDLKPPPLSEEKKQAIKKELELSDRFTAIVGNRICDELRLHQKTVQGAVDTFVEPQIRRLLSQLQDELSFPPQI